MHELRKRFFILTCIAGICFLLLRSSIVFGAPSYYDPTNIPPTPVGSGTVYYISATNGSDSYDGLAPTYNGKDGPFKTIGHAIDRYSGRNKGGNTFLIEAGTYYEYLSVGNITGTSAANPLVIGAYGGGPAIIQPPGTNLTWTVTSNPKIFSAPCALTLDNGKYATTPNAVIIDDNFRTCRPCYQAGQPIGTFCSPSSLTSYGQWTYDASTQTIYVYTDGKSPASHGAIVTKLDANNVEPSWVVEGPYVIIHGLELIGASSIGIYSWANNVTVEDCEIKYSGKSSLVLTGQYDSVIMNSLHGNILMNWPRGRTWDSSGGWPEGMTTKGAYAEVSGNLVYDNGGEGIGISSNSTVENNISDNNWSVNIYLCNTVDDVVRDNVVFDSPLNRSDAEDASQIPTWTNIDKIYCRMQPSGISTGDEGTTAVSTGNQIYNNIIVGCPVSYVHNAETTDGLSGIKNIVFSNNTIIMPTDIGDTYYAHEGIRIPYDNGNNSNSVFENNIIYSLSNNSQYALIAIDNASDPGIQIKNNLFYSPNELNSLQIGTYPATLDTFSAWQSAISFQSGNILGDPVFSSDPTTITNPALLAAALAIQSSSPAVGKALSPVSLFTTDFNGASRGTAWDIGAIQHGGTLSAVTGLKLVSPK
ncbi:MAG: hypothetical protein ACP5IL_06885 [Syntrophobacteraceae bacterium]